MDADRWLGAWPCYLPNSGISVSYAGEAPSAAATRSAVCWLTSSQPQLTTCSPADSCKPSDVCRPSYIEVTATVSSSSSSSHVGLLKPAAAAAAGNVDKQINDTGTG